MDDEESLNQNGLLYKLLQARDDDNNMLTQEEIIDNLFTLVFAGSDTTAAAAASICLVLTQNMGLRRYLIDTPDSVESFVTQVVEAFPPAPFQMRETTQSVNVGSFQVPSGWLVGYGFAAALDHLNAPTSETVQVDVQPTSSSVAFGSGPRKCPGRYLASSELFEFTKIMLKNELELEPDQNLQQRYTPGLFPVDGLRVRFVS